MIPDESGHHDIRQCWVGKSGQDLIFHPRCRRREVERATLQRRNNSLVLLRDRTALEFMGYTGHDSFLLNEKVDYCTEPSSCTASMSRVSSPLVRTDSAQSGPLSPIATPSPMATPSENRIPSPMATPSPIATPLARLVPSRKR